MCRRTERLIMILFAGGAGIIVTFFIPSGFVLFLIGALLILIGCAIIKN